MKKKGFTLIELLSVIVVLAVIALITIPVVINIINNSKRGAAEDSTYGVIESLKLHWMSSQKNFTDEASESTIVCGSSTCDFISKGSTQTVPIETFYSTFSGTKPTEGTYVLSDGKVTVSGVKFGDYYCNSDEDEKVSCSKDKITYVYYSYGTGPTTASAAEQVRPSTQVYFKYKVTNNILGTPQACVYYNSKELCINNKEQATSVAKLEAFFGNTCSNNSTLNLKGCGKDFIVVDVGVDTITMEDDSNGPLLCNMDSSNSVNCGH